MVEGSIDFIVVNSEMHWNWQTSGSGMERKEVVVRELKKQITEGLWFLV